jgi:hypothetical protein
MTERERIIRSGRFKGKKIELAPTHGVDAFQGIAEEFMTVIFEMDPDSYLITDESSLRDFEGTEDTRLEDIYARIRSVFDIDVRDVRSGNLVEIFARIHRHRYGAPG